MKNSQKKFQFQCPKCKTIYDEDMGTFLDGWWKSIYDNEIYCMICDKWVKPIITKSLLP